MISWPMAFLDSVTIRGRAKELSALFYKTVAVPEGRDTSTTELVQISSYFYDQVHPWLPIRALILDRNTTSY